MSVHSLLSSRGRCPDFRLSWALLHTPPHPARCVSYLVLLHAFFLSPLLLSLRSLCHILMLTCITYICPITSSSGRSPCLQLLPPSSLPDLTAMASPQLPVSPCCFLAQAQSLSCSHNPTSLSVLPLWLPHRNVLLQPDGLSVSPWGISLECSDTSLQGDCCL